MSSLGPSKIEVHQQRYSFVMIIHCPFETPSRVTKRKTLACPFPLHYTPLCMLQQTENHYSDIINIKDAYYAGCRKCWREQSDQLCVHGFNKNENET